MTTQALEVVHAEPPAALLPSEVDLRVMGSIARMAVQAAGHSIPAHLNSPGKVMAVLLAGFEAGLRPMSSLRHCYVVNGRVEFSAQALAGIVMAKDAGLSFEVVSSSPTECTMRLRRPSRGIVAEYTHTLEMARQAGLVKNGNPWSLYGADMLRWSCLKRLVRLYASDLANNIGGAEVAMASALVDEPGPMDPIDLETVPAEQLYSPGDSPDQTVVELANGTVADAETGEVLEVEGIGLEEPTSADAEPFDDAMPTTVKGYLEWASVRYELPVEEILACHGTTDVAELRARGLGDLMVEVAEYAARVGSEVTEDATEGRQEMPA